MLASRRDSETLVAEHTRDYPLSLSHRLASHTYNSTHHTQAPLTRPHYRNPAWASSSQVSRPLMLLATPTRAIVATSSPSSIHKRNRLLPRNVPEHVWLSTVMLFSGDCQCPYSSHSDLALHAYHLECGGLHCYHNTIVYPTDISSRVGKLSDT